MAADTRVGASKEAAKAAAISFLANLTNETEISIFCNWFLGMAGKITEEET